LRVLFDYSSVEALRDDWMASFPGMIGQVISAAVPGAGAVLTDDGLRSMARELFVMIPAWFGVFCVIFAWAADRLIRLLFVWLSCPSVFTDEDADVSVPASFAAVYGGVFLLYLLSVSGTLPHAVLRTLLLIMGLPCAAVGVRRISERLADRLFYLSREKFFIGVLLFAAFTILGAFPFLLTTSVVGAVSILLRYFRTKKKEP
ncbi:MAG: hypothetical protein J6Q17_05825, partial [Clostridia bacterium]|nr:hypothetical protein [Clostridia bacterium]